ncbi:MAG: NADH-quinone oxidoreductase subunit N [Elusimicrobia bacterium]|nr:NADH-quinone oxidoreductase subunit N [Elusimicrobiota bacterium]
MENIFLLLPEIVLSLFALILLFTDPWAERKSAPVVLNIGLIGVGAALLALGHVTGASAFSAGTLWVLDPVAVVFKTIVLVATFAVLFLSMDYQSLPRRHLGSFASLALWSAVGMMAITGAVDLLLIFVGLELVSLSSFILAGFDRPNLKSSEGAIKYFLIGAFSSAIMLFGISLFYGATGTTKLLSVLPVSTPLFVLALILITVGFGFKVSMVPFHLWVPDAYEGAPTPVTAYLSVAPKVATLAVMLRVFTVLVPHAGVHMTGLFTVLCVLTMTVGNLTAIFQDNVKRLLAYSSIAQAGYMLIGFVVATPLGQQAVVIYSVAYLFMNFGAFAVATVVGEREGSYELSAFDGMAQRNLGMSLLMVCFLLSLAGIPPLAGFIGKFYIFSSAVNAELYWLALAGLLNSVVSVYYYLRIAYHMFFVPPSKRAPINVGFYWSGTIVLAAAGTLLLGIFPQPFMEYIQLSTKFLP